MTPPEVHAFKPRLAPRDAADTALVVLVGLFQSAVLFLLPALLVYIAFPNLALALATSVALYVIFVLHLVKEVTVASDGIRFTRLLGNPKFLPWPEITEVVPAPRRELVIHGWLWPLLPAREMSPAHTTLGHYRIQFGKRFTYFPPADPQAFVAAIKRFSNAEVAVHAGPAEDARL